MWISKSIFNVLYKEYGEQFLEQSIGLLWAVILFNDYYNPVSVF